MVAGACDRRPGHDADMLSLQATLLPVVQHPPEATSVGTVSTLIN